jgi:hypothetical protein
MRGTEGGEMPDRRDLAAHLEPGEALLWQGRPDPAAPGPGAPGCLRWAGVALLVPLAFLLYLAATQWTDLAEVRGLMLGALAVNAFAAGMFLRGIGWLARRGHARTRYGVIAGHGVILQGLGPVEVHRWPLVPGFVPRIEPHGSGGLCRVVFGQVTRRMDVGATKVPVTTDLAFEGLTAAEAEAALAALRRAGAG